ncbi:DUF6343 family protein [Phytoactinopolyspora halotolerans]|uniref:Uncharacterized protein n=1 Tax=Phytoactinopolyspora halotolerans TaxID=1981512 RepID=A0A6L9SI20_9ACTN|nr:DUF6343 family protein [Phytoactinopolyspora halotolerans]NEE04284.1 hypothetical protein [Phytoactinopolyspora halotolerans]
MQRSSPRRWFRRPEGRGTEPWNARSVYRTRIALAMFGFVVAGAAATVFAIRALNDGRPADTGAAVVFGVIASVALINAVVVGVRRHGARTRGR